MSDIGSDVFAEWGVVPEYVVPLSVFSVVSRGWFCRVYRYPHSSSTFCYGGAAWSKDALSDERDGSLLLMPAGMFFVVVGGWLLSRWTVIPFIRQSSHRKSRSVCKRWCEYS